MSTIHVVRELKTQGFIVSSYLNRTPEAIQKLSQWLGEGKLKVTETIEAGFEHVPRALRKLFTGEKTGKMVVDVL